MERTRIQLADGVYLTYLPARKFKTSLLSAQFVTPLQHASMVDFASSFIINKALCSTCNILHSCAVLS